MAVKKVKVEEKKPVIKKVVTKKPEVTKLEVVKSVNKTKGSLTIDVVDINGKSIESIKLPEEIFGEKENKKLISQAIRVYLANQRQGTVSTKTRGEVQGSTRKIYRQKGTGRARHGGIRAPIFVKGGIAHGPKPRDYSLSLSKKMRKQALFSSLSAKVIDKNIKVVSGLEKIEQKTKLFSKFIKSLLIKENEKVLLVTPEKLENVYKAARNMEGVSIVSANMLNTYEVLNNKTIIFMKSAIQTLEKVFLKSGKESKK